MTHTPTPWETRELSNGDWAISQKGAPTAHTTVHAWNGKEESATAQFIVQACNAHEELVVALKGLAKEINLSKLNVRKDFSLMNAYAYATKIIAKAEGKE